MKQLLAWRLILSDSNSAVEKLKTDRKFNRMSPSIAPSIAMKTVDLCVWICGAAGLASRSTAGWIDLRCAGHARRKPLRSESENAGLPLTN